jgi:hypothetical protein
MAPKRVRTYKSAEIRRYSAESLKKGRSLEKVLQWAQTLGTCWRLGWCWLVWAGVAGVGWWWLV